MKSRNGNVFLLRSMMITTTLMVVFHSKMTCSFQFPDLNQIKDFKYYSYSEIVDILMQLNEAYPEFVELIDGVEHYNLTVPSSIQCDVNGNILPCKHYILRITNEGTLPDPDRPEVFFSGALHGNERVGPSTVVELALLLVQHRIDPQGNPWLKYLVNTRSIFLLPMTNPMGYSLNRREENEIDPNRDFNYLRSGPGCMVTMTARVLNELWRDHIFQLAITFHAGMRAIAYEWGSNNHYHLSRKGHESPDNLAQTQIGNALSLYSGAFKDRKFYPSGMMNDIVYGVDGGMEDWAYAASWENQYSSKDRLPFQPCSPDINGAYPENQTIYNNVTHRTFNILVETSNSKYPLENTLGNSASLSLPKLAQYLTKEETVGHITRNIRLSLMIIDLVQPYITWINEDTNDCNGNQAVACINTSSTVCQVEKNSWVQFTWQVDGAFQVDQTKLMWSTTKDFEKDATNYSLVQNGFTRWSTKEQGTTSKKTFFSHCILSPSEEGQQLYFKVMAIVDQDWAENEKTQSNRFPHIVPQSHVVNARTNKDWKMENKGHRVIGQVEWYSSVVNLESIVQHKMDKRDEETPHLVEDEKVSVTDVNQKMFFSNSTTVFLLLLVFVMGIIVGLLIGRFRNRWWEAEYFSLKPPLEDERRVDTANMDDEMEDNMEQRLEKQGGAGFNDKKYSHRAK